MNLPKEVTETIILTGGVDLSTPAAISNPGYGLSIKNYEPELGGGYGRLAGSEAFDGRPAPSDAIYYLVELDATGAIVVGDTLTGDTSAATGIVIAINGVDVGITALTGGYQAGESANGQAIVKTEAQSGQVDVDLENAWKLAAQNHYRTAIAAVPGEGPVLGVIQHLDKTYAFRNAVGGAIAEMYESSVTGWVKVDLFGILKFDAGTMADGEIGIEDVLTGASSGASGIVKDFIKHGGSYGSTAYGYIVIDVTTGAFTDGENIQKTATTKAVADGPSTPIILNPNGRYEFESHNFFGDDSTYFLYGCDGENPGFQFDGVTYTPILMGATELEDEWNKPLYVDSHKGHLFFAFKDGSLQHSEPGQPVQWSGFLGAAEFGVGSLPTGIKSIAGGVLVVKTRRVTYGLYGNNVADWNLAVTSEDSGALPYTVQTVGTVFALDDPGITRLDRVQSFGDFESATVSRLIRPLIDQVKGQVVGTSIKRSKSQYRIYLDDGSGIIMTVDPGSRKTPYSFTSFSMPHIPYCMSNNEDDQGNERIFIGADDGFVYELEKGSSWNGAEMEYTLRLRYNNSGRPTLRKGYKRLGMEIDCQRNVDLLVNTAVSYGAPNIPVNVGSAIEHFGGAGFWNVDFWNQFFWSAAEISARTIPLAGTGNNISISIYGKSAVTEPFVLQALHLGYFNRRPDIG